MSRGYSNCSYISANTFVTYKRLYHCYPRLALLSRPSHNMYNPFLILVLEVDGVLLNCLLWNITLYFFMSFYSFGEFPYLPIYKTTVLHRRRRRSFAIHWHHLSLPFLQQKVSVGKLRNSLHVQIAYFYCSSVFIYDSRLLCGSLQSLIHNTLTQFSLRWILTTSPFRKLLYFKLSVRRSFSPLSRPTHGPLAPEVLFPWCSSSSNHSTAIVFSFSLPSTSSRTSFPHPYSTQPTLGSRST